jgi:hypothetical protein
MVVCLNPSAKEFDESVVSTTLTNVCRAEFRYRCHVYRNIAVFLNIQREHTGNICKIFGYSGPFTLAIFTAIFCFWCMGRSRWVVNVLRVCTLIWTFITHPFVHIHQKTKIASLNGLLERFRFDFHYTSQLLIRIWLVNDNVAAGP